MRSETLRRLPLRAAALTYLALIVAIPVAVVFGKAFSHGASAAFDAVTTPDALHALKMTGLMVLVALPINVVVGIVCGIALARGPRRLQAPLGALLALPFAVPPVVVGLALFLLYGRDGWISLPFQVLFSWPGMVLASIFISLPFVAREVAPVLRELGREPEEAAETLGAGRWMTFRRVTLPALGPALTYGIVLTMARILGEYGAVSVVSGRLAGQTQTLPLYVEDRYSQFDPVGAYSAAVLLAVLALLTLALMLRLRWQSTS